MLIVTPKTCPRHLGHLQHLESLADAAQGPQLMALLMECDAVMHQYIVAPLTEDNVIEINQGSYRHMNHLHLKIHLSPEQFEDAKNASELLMSKTKRLLNSKGSADGYIHKHYNKGAAAGSSNVARVVERGPKTHYVQHSRPKN